MRKILFITWLLSELGSSTEHAF